MGGTSMTISKYLINLSANEADEDKSKRSDRLTIAEAMKVWAENRSKIRSSLSSEIDLCGFHYIISTYLPNQLKIQCGKYSWVEDYSPVYITARFTGTMK